MGDLDSKSGAHQWITHHHSSVRKGPREETLHTEDTGDAYRETLNRFDDKHVIVFLGLSSEFERREQLKTLGIIVGCDATVFTAGKIKKFMETDPQYHFEQRIKESHGPLRRGLRFLFRQGLIRKRCKGKRIVYEVENWKQLEELYHKLLWRSGVFKHPS